KAPARKTSRPAATATTTNTWMIHEKALKEFERGMGLLQKQGYAEALEHFQSIVATYPQEKELVDRAGIYLRICQSMLDKKEPQPRSTEDFFYHGVIKASHASYDDAVQLLEKALATTPKDEKVHYVLASTLALKGDRREALDHLKAAIELNATNRI